MVRGKAGPKPGPVDKKGKPKADKPKAEKASKPASGEVAKAAASVDRDRQRLAIVHRDAYAKAKERQQAANKAMTKLAKLIKADGFTTKQIKIMVEIATPEGEAAVKLSVMQTLEAAKWSNSPLGNQLDLFGEPDRRPSTDMAFEEGVADAMAGKTASPGYAPSVPQHASYLKGYHEEQERMIAKGIKKLDPEEQKTRAAVLASSREANATVN